MVPHAPLLLPELGGNRAASVAEAVASIDLSGAETIVIASPHGSATGVYRVPRGVLDAFGPRGLSVDAEPGPAEDLARAWAHPVLDAGADHGIVVPLRLLAPAAPVVAVAFREGAAGEAGLAGAVASLPGKVAFVASVNLSPGLDERSPLPSLEGAAEADAAVLGALRRDPAALADVDLDRAGSCAAPVLAAFGSLFAGRSCDVLAYEQPFGVGYAVAVTR